MDASLAKDVLTQTLSNLEHLREIKRKELADKRREYDKLETELRAVSAALRSIEGSILALRADLGLEMEPILRMQEAKAAEESEQPDQTRGVMLVVARFHDHGGIGFDQILTTANDEGVGITREYLHTVLNRKKRLGKLLKENNKWFLTDRGKKELGLDKT